ncbi:response regulator, partial [Rubrivirga sp.]|uniref:response regulator n=1 Tax=Rubrivirga sp. TaxID=1885344 RepID=UPI003C7918C9
DKLDAVFESFSQADASTTREYGGTGLGLTICRRLTEMMGGSMAVASVEGEGSTFSFDIQATVAQTERRVFARSDQPALEGKRVLIVDDNDVNREILSRLTSRWQMPSAAVHSGVEAVEAIRSAVEDGDPYDLVLLDMQMPEMDGLETAQAIRLGKGGDAPAIVMLTSINRDASLRERALAAGVHRVLYKPTKPAQIYEVLMEVFGAKRAPATGERRSAWIARPAETEGPVAPTRTGLRVLIAEDNVVNQKVAVRLLGRLHVKADVVANGAEAVTEVERRCLFGEAYDVVFMDVQMPVMDGLEATQRIRALEGVDQPRIIALTANAMDGDRERCLEAGCDDYLTKPVQLPALRDALERSHAARDLEVVSESTSSS